MHRGSSKAGRGAPPAADNLPLSAPSLTVEVEVARGGRSHIRVLALAHGTKVREAVRQVGLAPEGTSVLVDGVSVPLDLPIERPVRLVVVPTFSGG
jgi:sulfur carrier protein ThiS